MNTQDLINELAQRGRPVKVVSSPSKSFAKWVLISSVWLVAGMLFIGVRENYMSIFENSYLWFSSLLSLSLSLASTMSALLISIPNRHSRSVYLVPFITICTWTIYLFYHYFIEGLSSPGEGILCLRDFLMFSLVPGILLMRILSQGSVLQGGVAGGFSLLGAAGLGAFGAQFTCRDDFALHILAWHFFPIVILTFIGIVVGRKLLNK